MKTELKVCGVNDGAFAAEAERLGVDYLGFVFAPGTPRAVTPGRAAAIMRRLRGRAKRVGVFVDDAPVAVLRVVRTLGLDVVQLHRRATAADVAALRRAGVEVWALAGGAPGDGVVFDSSHGDGEAVFRPGAWKGAKIVVAGGISVGNIEKAMEFAPDVIDVSGSLESAPGVKSVPHLRAFVSAFSALADSPSF